MKKNFIFYSPNVSEPTLRWLTPTREFKDLHLIGLGQNDHDYIRSLGVFDDYCQVPNAQNYYDLEKGVAEILVRYPQVDGLITMLENFQIIAAQLREKFNLPGMHVDDIMKFRDKTYMKKILKEKGVACSDFARVESDRDAKEFIKQNGYPFIIKPAHGAGCRSTYLIHNEREYSQCLEEIPLAPDMPAIIEEFIEGDEGAFDSLTLNGQVKFYSIVHYHPTPLEATENPWIQSIYFVDKDAFTNPAYYPLRKLGQDTVTALGLDTSITHMEWFYRKKDKKFYVGEIAARPAGDPMPILHNYAFEINLFREVGNLMINKRVDISQECKWNVGFAALRAQGSGFITGITGLEEVHRRVGHLIIDEHIPDMGTPQKTYGYLGEGHIYCRGKNYQEVFDACKFIINTVRVQAEP